MSRSIDSAVNWSLAIAEDNTHGYDQEHRNGPDYDCSSFVGTALYHGGFNVSPYSTTRNLYEQLKAAGFEACSEPWQKGDVHLTPGEHVVLSISKDLIVHASINEFGGITGGQTGDQTGKEICTREFYTPSYGWKYHLRYTGNNVQPGGTERATKGASSFDKSIAGVYTTTDNLRMRNGGSVNDRIMHVVPAGATVRNYGYYTGEFYYVAWVHGSVTSIGFCHKDYLKKG